MRPPNNALSLLPSSEQLEVYSKLDPNLPSLLIKAIDNQLEREYKYATRGQHIALICFLSVLVSFCVLVVTGHPAVGGVLLGTSIIGLITGFIKARLSEHSAPHMLSEALQEPADEREPS